MFSHNGKISTRQVTILLILQMFNTNILLLPKLCTYYVGRNGYILPIVALVIGILYVYCITSLTMRFPNMTLVELTKSILPNWLAYILLILFSIKVLIGTGLELRMFGEMISQVMLPKTPIMVIMSIILLTTSYLVKSGVEATARMGEVLVYFIFVPLIIVFIIIALGADYRELLPLFQTNIESVGIGALNISFLFIPLEFLLMMTGMMEKPDKARKVGIVAIVIIAILESIIILLTIAEIGLGETQRQIWPVIALMQSIGLTNSVVENQEVLMMTGWVLSIFMYLSSGLYFPALIGSRSCKFKRENVFVLPLVPIILFIAIWPRGLVQAYDWYLSFQYYFGIWFLIPIPLILLLIAKFRRLGSEK